ncbi:unnamed protein product [Adineta steineri]|uniref:Uncharacterized protein n=1 Tax=Adineta steineri TaxID=433720 RepID=A0A813UH36_9BILA|nr:unnamed protein product [Adineta steineri]
MKGFLFLLFLSINEINISQQIVTAAILSNLNQNDSLEEVVDTNSSRLSSKNKETDITPIELVFDNKYSDQIAEESNISTEVFHSGPQYEVNWSFIDKETVRVNFSLFLFSNSSNETNSFKNTNQIKINNTYPHMVSVPLRSNHSMYSLKYFLFIIRHYKQKKVTEKQLYMEQLTLKNSSVGINDHFSNTLLLIRLNAKEKYSVCIYYYQVNSSTQMPDLFICQDIIHDHVHSTHGLLFVLTQYSIILGLLIVLQGLYSMRKRRLAHIVHQHLLNKTQRIRSTLSSVSLIRHSFSSMDGPTEHKHTMNGHIENKLHKRIISSPAIVLSDPSVPLHNNADENEPFLKLTSSKNHVHFLLGLDEGSDDNDSGDIQIDSTVNQQVPSIQIEPYSDQPDALLSMAHILDTNKPWCKHSHSTMPV